MYPRRLAERDVVNVHILNFVLTQVYVYVIGALDRLFFVALRVKTTVCCKGLLKGVCARLFKYGV